MGPIRHHQAMLWLAEGKLLRDDITVPAPPPHEFNIAIQEPVSFARLSALPDTHGRIQTARFRLTGYTPTGEVIHYLLDSRPPAGWEWMQDGNGLKAVRSRGGRI